MIELTRRSFLGGSLRVIAGVWLAYKGIGTIPRPDPDYDLDAVMTQIFMDAIAKDMLIEEDIILNGYVTGVTPDCIVY